MCKEPSTRVYSSSAFFRRIPFQEHGGFRLELGPSADNFIMRLLGLLYGAGYAKHTGSVWFRNPGSMSDAAMVNPWLNLDVAARITWLMRNPYRDVFPEAAVKYWEEDFREHAVETFLAGLTEANDQAARRYRWGTAHVGSAGRLASGLIRQMHRIVGRLQERSVRRVLRNYQGNVDCYAGVEQ